MAHASTPRPRGSQFDTTMAEDEILREASRWGEREAATVARRLETEFGPAGAAKQPRYTAQGLPVDTELLGMAQGTNGCLKILADQLIKAQTSGQLSEEQQRQCLTELDKVKDFARRSTFAAHALRQSHKPPRSCHIPDLSGNTGTDADQVPAPKALRIVVISGSDPTAVVPWLTSIMETAVDHGLSEKGAIKTMYAYANNPLRACLFDWMTDGLSLERIVGLVEARFGFVLAPQHARAALHRTRRYPREGLGPFIDRVRRLAARAVADSPIHLRQQELARTVRTTVMANLPTPVARKYEIIEVSRGVMGNPHGCDDLQAFTEDILSIENSLGGPDVVCADERPPGKRNPIDVVSNVVNMIQGQSYADIGQRCDAFGLPRMTPYQEQMHVAAEEQREREVAQKMAALLPDSDMNNVMMEAPKVPEDITKAFAKSLESVVGNLAKTFAKSCERQSQVLINAVQGSFSPPRQPAHVLQQAVAGPQMQGGSDFSASSPSRFRQNDRNDRGAYRHDNQRRGTGGPRSDNGGRRLEGSRPPFRQNGDRPLGGRDGQPRGGFVSNNMNQRDSGRNRNWPRVTHQSFGVDPRSCFACSSPTHYAGSRDCPYNQYDLNPYPCEFCKKGGHPASVCLHKRVPDQHAGGSQAGSYPASRQGN